MTEWLLVVVIAAGGLVYTVPHYVSADECQDAGTKVCKIYTDQGASCSYTCTKQVKK